MSRKPTKTADLIPLNPLASFDLGNANSKIKTLDLATEFRSIYGRFSKSRRFGQMESPLVFALDGETFVWGDDARNLIDGEPVAHTDMNRYTSPSYRCQFAAALWRAFRPLATSGIVYPIIVSSIPVQAYANGLADAVKSNVCGDYVIDGPDEITLHVNLTPQNLVIIPEGTGSYFQALNVGSGLGGREVAILDVGFYTTDLVIFAKGGAYVAGSARSCKHGVQQVALRVEQYLLANHRYNGDLWAVDNALENGTIDIANRCVGIAEPRDEAYADLLDDILKFYDRSRGSRTPGAVLCAGGGANNVYRFLHEDLKDEGWRVVPGNPRRSNVDGGFLFLLQRQSKLAANV